MSWAPLSLRWRLETQGSTQETSVLNQTIGPDGCKTMCFFFGATCSGSSETSVDFDWLILASNFDDLVGGHHKNHQSLGMTSTSRSAVYPMIMPFNKSQCFIGIPRGIPTDGLSQDISIIIFMRPRILPKSCIP